MSVALKVIKNWPALEGVGDTLPPKYRIFDRVTSSIIQSTCFTPIREPDLRLVVIEPPSISGLNGLSNVGLGFNGNIHTSTTVPV